TDYGSARPALDIDAPAVVGDDAVNDREPQPGSLFLGGEEGFEDGGVRREAPAIVLDLEAHLAVGCAQRDLHPSAAAGRLDRISKQIQKHMLHLLIIELQRDWLAGIERKLHSVRLSLRRNQRHGDLSGVAQVYPREPERLGSRKFEKVLDQPGQALHFAG